MGEIVKIPATGGDAPPGYTYPTVATDVAFQIRMDVSGQGAVEENLIVNSQQWLSMAPTVAVAPTYGTAVTGTYSSLVSTGMSFGTTGNNSGLYYLSRIPDLNWTGGDDKTWEWVASWASGSTELGYVFTEKATDRFGVNDKGLLAYIDYGGGVYRLNLAFYSDDATYVAGQINLGATNLGDAAWRWYRLIMTGNSISLKINGTTVGSSVDLSTLSGKAFTNYGFAIGQYNATYPVNAGAGWNGSMSFFRISNNATNQLF